VITQKRFQTRYAGFLRAEGVAVTCSFER
jgi:hypothetical protein